jgi:hypothetical protein
VKPNAPANGEKGSQIPMLHTMTVLSMSEGLAALSTKGIRFVRMT